MPRPLLHGAPRCLCLRYTIPYLKYRRYMAPPTHPTPTPCSSHTPYLTPPQPDRPTLSLPTRRHHGGEEHPHPHPFLPRAPDRVLQVAHTPGAAESHLHRLYGPRVRQDGARGLFPLLVRARTDVKATSASISCRSCFEPLALIHLHRDRQTDKQTANIHRHIGKARVHAHTLTCMRTRTHAQMLACPQTHGHT